MEIQFQKVRLEHKDLIQGYFGRKCAHGCESVFANIYLWHRVYKTEFAILEDCLIFSTPHENGYPGISFPAGNPSDVKRAIESLLEFFKERNLPFQLYMVQPCEFQMLEEDFPSLFEIAYNRGLFDYVYEREKLATLSGRKLHGKRNHIHKFEELYPDWVYEPITKENIEDCFQMSMEWRSHHDAETDDDIRNEVGVTMNALRLMEELSLKGGLLRVNGEVVAFTIGEPLTADTFVVHIEKAFSEVQGAYPVINQQFVLHEMEAFTYVNREEDTGAEGLRKAKMSYRPVFLVEKGIVSLKENPK